MRGLRALAHLLAYPSEALVAGLREIEAECAREFSPETCAELRPLFEELRRIDVLSLQERYVALFDSTRSLSLHLFEHVHGDARERGSAMVTLQELYAGRGLEPRAGELPDYLPALCEFASLLDPPARQRILHDAAGIFTALRTRLRKRQSAYASVFAALIELAEREPLSAELAANLAQLERSLDAESISRSAEESRDRRRFDEIDRIWEEAAVEFGPGSPSTDDTTSCGAQRPAPLHSILEAPDAGPRSS